MIELGPPTPGVAAFLANRPSVTSSAIASLAQAVLTGSYVPDDVLRSRLAICGQCDLKRTDAAGIDFCGVCGCSVSADSRKLTNLAAYGENLPKWGCKHPNRQNGKGWPVETKTPGD